MTNVLVVAILLLGNAFFVAGEFALIAARRTVIEPMAATSKRARLALSAMEQIPLMIAGAQLGVTVCSLGLGAIAEPAFAHLLTGVLDLVRMPQSMAHPVAFVLALIVVVFAHWAARQVLRIWRIEAADAVKTVYTAEELAGLVAQARTEGLLNPEEHARITGALALHERTAADAMRPWSSVTTVYE